MPPIGPHARRLCSFSCALALLPVLLTVLLQLASCSSGHHYFRMTSSDATVEGGSGRPTFVACYRDGQLLGAAAADDPDFPFRDWLLRNDEGPVVDHPELSVWREHLARLEELAAMPEPDPDALVRHARALPFRRPVEDALGRWAGADPARAAALLDLAGPLPIGDGFAGQLAHTALRGAPGDGRLAGWVRELCDEGHDEAALVLLRSGRAGAATARAALAVLSEIASTARPEVFAAAAAHLAGEPEAAAEIVAAADELPASHEARALEALLAADASPALARQVLRHLDERSAGDRARLFVRAAPALFGDPEGLRAIVWAVRELPGRSRLDAALSLADRPDGPAELAVLLVEHVDDLPGRDRETLLFAVLDGPHGRDPRLREACAEAARRDLSSRPRSRVLARLQQ